MKYLLNIFILMVLSLTMHEIAYAGDTTKNLKDIIITDFDSMYSYFSSFSSKKDEYEKTSDFNDKLKWWSKTEENVIVMKNNWQTKGKYNADRSELILGFCFGPSSSALKRARLSQLGIDSYMGLIVENPVDNNNAYRIKTAKNPSMLVEQNQKTYAKLLPLNSNNIPTVLNKEIGILPITAFTIKNCTPELARRLKEKSVILYEVTVSKDKNSSSYTVYKEFKTPQILGDPSFDIAHVYGIYVILRTAYLYDPETGDLIARLDFKF